MENSLEPRPAYSIKLVEPVTILPDGKFHVAGVIATDDDTGEVKTLGPGVVEFLPPQGS